MADQADPVMARCRAAFEKSRKSLDEVGRAMGYGAEVARQSTWQFLNRTRDPRLSMLRRFARAVGVKLQDLIAE
jgi:hypothetical protein